MGKGINEVVINKMFMKIMYGHRELKKLEQVI